MDAQHVSGEIRKAADQVIADIAKLGEHTSESVMPTVHSMLALANRIKRLSDEIAGAK
jgi:hypothetical protein